jgi:hypothetical protein
VLAEKIPTAAFTTRTLPGGVSRLRQEDEEGWGGPQKTAARVRKEERRAARASPGGDDLIYVRLQLLLFRTPITRISAKEFQHFSAVLVN